MAFRSKTIQGCLSKQNQIYLHTTLISIPKFVYTICCTTHRSCAPIDHANYFSTFYTSSKCLFGIFNYLCRLQLLAYKDFRPQETPIVEVPQEEPSEAEADGDAEDQPKTPAAGPPPKKDGPSPSTPSSPVPSPPPQGPPVEQNEAEANVASSISQTDPSDQEVKWLWDYTCDLTEGKNISCMCWNKVLQQAIVLHSSSCNSLTKK